jgi:hypothetical protein
LLQSATCLYYDGSTPDRDVSKALDLVDFWFDKFNEKPRVVLVGGDKNLLKGRFSTDTLRRALENRAQHQAIETVQFFPRGRGTIDDTWRPSIYFALSLRPPKSAFFCINATLSEEVTQALLLEGDTVLDSCASYGYLFPAWFSPLGYYWGISVEPSYRALGAWGRGESERLSHWRDNAKIGIEEGGDRRFRTACDGYLRDVYPLMLLGERHLDRKTREGTLGDALRMPTWGQVSDKNGKCLWRVKNDKLIEVQHALDASGITLSGRRL